MSISKNQAKLLASGFLDGIGDSKDDFIPVETFGALFEAAGEFVINAQDNLIQDNSIASGALSRELEIGRPDKVVNTVTVPIMMLPYGWFVNDGVKGLKGGSGLYKFKYPTPSKKMVEAIQIWIKRSGLQVRTVKKAVSPLERKRKSISELNKGRQVAFAVSRSILNKGIKATGFIDRATNKTAESFEQKLGLGFTLDISNSIPGKLNSK